nr:reverse transcriptase domain-containing protein [Tanacetum cinerariifolium]GEZ58378.1 reverse transcriptase domain-containing protein [Tanacetum cinerariifolium]
MIEGILSSDEFPQLEYFLTASEDRFPMLSERDAPAEEDCATDEVKCMRTRNSYFLNNSSVTIPRRRNKRRTPNVVEPELRTIFKMADNRTMKELLQAPTEGYGEAIVILEINADHFEIKTNLLQLVQANPYHGFERENPHTHINNFKRITSTLKFGDVPNDVIKLMMFSYSLEGNARVWYDKEPPNSILTWEDLNQASTSGTLPSNTIPNPKGEMEAITTRSGVAYEGPLIPTPKKVVKQETEETTDKERINFQGRTAHIQPPVTPIPEPDVPKTLPKPNIPYPLRLNDQNFAKRLRIKWRSSAKSFKICTSTLKKLYLPELTPTQMTLELANRSSTHPKGVAEDVFVKVRKFYFSTDFVVVDFEADPRVPLILGRSFLRTGRALIDVYREEITLRVNDESVTFNLNQTTEEHAQEILGFFNNSLGGNPTSNFEPILFYSSLSLTPFEGSDFILKEFDAYLKDESISPEIDHADCDPEGDICLIEKLLNDDPFQLPLMDLKQGVVVKVKSLIEEPSELELKELPSHLEYAYLEGVNKLPVITAKDSKVDKKRSSLKSA